MRGRAVGKSTTTLAVLSALAVAMALPAFGKEPDAHDLLKRALDALPKAPFVAQVTLSVSGGATRQLQLSHKVVQGARASYLEVLAPKDIRGIRFLFLEHAGRPAEQYIKVAASRKSLRVADTIRKQPFLGSTFYIADLVETEIDAFTYKFVGEEEEIGGRRCKLIASVPKKPEQEIYGSTIVAVDPKDLLILKREFSDSKGHLLKVWTVDRVEKIDGYWTLREQRMANVQEQTQSRLEITDIKYNVALEDAMFTPKYLAR